MKIFVKMKKISNEIVSILKNNQCNVSSSSMSSVTYNQYIIMKLMAANGVKWNDTIMAKKMSINVSKKAS